MYPRGIPYVKNHQNSSQVPPTSSQTPWVTPCRIQVLDHFPESYTSVCPPFTQEVCPPNGHRGQGGNDKDDEDEDNEEGSNDKDDEEEESEKK